MRFLPLPVLFAISLSAAPGLTLVKVSEVVRTEETAPELSGIAWAGGSLYYAVDDHDGTLHELTLEIDPESGAIVTNTVTPGVRLSGARDPEGCAYDAASRCVWVCTEADSAIHEFRPSDGATLRSAPVPDILLHPRSNLGLEALALSPDGLSLWTANEEALPGDGPASSVESGTLVRLARFSRRSPNDEWRPSGQWAYAVTEHPAESWGNGNQMHTRSGVSALAILPDGTLLALERMLSGRNFFSASFRTRIYAVSLDGATDVSGIPSLAEADIVPVSKTLLFNERVGWTNYEGMCAGPMLADGSPVVVLVSDGGNCSRKLMTLRFRPPDASDGN